MKKILLTLLIVVTLAPAACAGLWAMRSYLEIMGQYSLIFNALDVMAVPADGNKTRAAYTPTLDFNGIFMFGGDDGIYALYVKKDHVQIINMNTIVFSSAAGTTVSNNEQWGIHYLGLGGRKYFFIDDWKMMQLLPYAAIDMGGYFTSNTVSKITIRDGSSALVSGDMEANGGFFGVNVEAGADFWVMNEVAVTSKIGYRFCSGVIRSANTGEPFGGAGALADVYDVEVDYSGFYVQFGVSFNFQRYD